MEFRILGPLEVVQDGRQVPLRGRRLRALLVCLLLHANELVSVDRLVDEVWGANPPRTVLASLQNQVSVLRKALGGERLDLGPGGYVLRVEAERFDLARFGGLVAEAEVAPPRERAELLRTALALWRGPPLADLAFEEFVQLEIARLEDLRLSVTEDWIDAELALGHHDHLVPELKGMVEEHPFDERLRGQLMLCLYRAGRQLDALALYQETRRVLVDELGVEPGPQLRELERAILRQDPALAAPSISLEPLQPSRRIVTVFFADLSSTVSEAIDPEWLRGALDRSSAAARVVVEGHGGTVENSGGVTLMAVFGSPKAHEDDPLRAVRSAIAVRDALVDRGGGFEPRIGVATGEAYIESSEAGVAGTAVNLAKRLQEAAQPGDILVSAATLRLVRHAVTSEAARPLRKASERPVPCFRLLTVAERAPTPPRHLDAPLVGRDQELAVLRAAYERSRDEGRPQLVTAIGEPGIGKTRLVLELVTWLRERATALTGSCDAYREGTSYLPLAHMIRQTGEDFATVTADTASIGELWLSVRHRFEELARDRPLVLVFEDVHWAEAALLDLVEYLGEQASGPILILCTARPELLEARRDWSSKVVALEALPEEHLQALVEALRADLTPDLREHVAAISGGNPLFAEQLVAHIEEEGTDGIEVVPPSLESLLASRLDLLPEEQRQLLQRAAVVGREFRADAVVELLPDTAAVVEEQLRSLTGKGLVEPAHSADLFTFHHVLVRDAAYASLPKLLRADLHEQTADWLARKGSPGEMTGYHLEQAYGYRFELGFPHEDIADLAQKARTLLAKAGSDAMARGDAWAAASLLTRARRLFAERETTDGYVLLELGAALLVCDRYSEAEATFAEAMRSGAASGDQRLEMLAALEQTSLQARHGADGSAQALQEIAQTAVSFFRRAGDNFGLARAWLGLAESHNMVMDYRTGAEAAKRALVHARKAGDGHQEALAHENLLFQLIRGPTPIPELLQQCETALEQSNHRSFDTVVLDLIASLHSMAGEFEKADAAERRRELDADPGISLLPYRERPQLQQTPEAAEVELRQAFELAERIGEKGWCSRIAASLAETMCLLGNDDEAARFAEASRELAPTDDLLSQILWRGALAKVLAQHGQLTEAEHYARWAVRLVEKTEALNAHSDALVDLGEVLQSRGRAEQAAQALKQALLLYERKGNLVSHAHARCLLDEITAGLSPAR